MDVSRLRALGWSAPTDFETGLKEAYRWYVDKRANENPEKIRPEAATLKSTGTSGSGD
jgi:dTDP-D-glucose 4,6-dehydratase